MASAATIFDASKTPTLPHGAPHSTPMPMQMAAPTNSSAQQLPATTMTPPFSPSFSGLPLQLPATAPANGKPSPAQSSPLNGSSPQPAADSEHYRRMTKDEWLQFCRAVGILKDGESSEEGAAVVVRATSRVWPPRGFRDGLYADVLYEKAKFTYWFHVLSTLRGILMLIQLALGAVLTALGATSGLQTKIAITVIAAVNTSIAGVLALMHNSGLPDRYRSDRNEFYKLEEHIKAIADTKLVPIDHGVNDVIAECWQRFQTALQSVQDNVPASYVPATSSGPAPRSGAGGATGAGVGSKIGGKASAVLHKMARSVSGSEK